MCVSVHPSVCYVYVCLYVCMCVMRVCTCTSVCVYVCTFVLCEACYPDIFDVMINLF